MASLLDALMATSETAQAEALNESRLPPLLAAFIKLQADRAKSAVTAPRDAYTGDLQVFDPATGHVSQEAMDRASGLAGLAMTGGLGGVSRGGSVLGSGPMRRLPMDEASRMARAAEQGFDTRKTFYHGSSDGSITDVDPTRTVRGVYGEGFYTTRMPAKADGYAGPEGSVYPVLLKRDRVLDLTTPEGRAIFDAARGNGGNAVLAKDYDIIKAPGETIVINPSAVRSRFAEFDPENRDSANLLASIAAAGAVPLGAVVNLGMMPPEGMTR